MSLRGWLPQVHRGADVWGVQSRPGQGKQRNKVSTNSTKHAATKTLATCYLYNLIVHYAILDHIAFYDILARWPLPASDTTNSRKRLAGGGETKNTILARWPR